MAGGSTFLQEDLKVLILEILKREGKERFSLLGYSLGGKIVLATIPHFPSLIDSVLLAAPDGVVVNAWYNVAVYPEWGRKLFKRFVVKPSFIFRVARMLRFTGVLSESFLNFCRSKPIQKIKDAKFTMFG
ncbi:MAG: hypothetical protein IPO83_14205 [Chitinophagaceae bacterium]|nr:hypothetical protein [Chitinophagaceae bacterium]